MGIFTGIEVLFFFLGAMSTLLGLGLYKLNQKYTFVWYTWVLACTGAFLAVFTVAWSVSSFLEGEVQAGNMGILFFGAPVLVIFGVTQRILRKSAQ